MKKCLDASARFAQAEHYWNVDRELLAAQRGGNGRHRLRALDHFERVLVEHLMSRAGAHEQGRNLAALGDYHADFDVSLPILVDRDARIALEASRCADQ